MSTVNSSAFHEVQPSELSIFDLPGTQTGVVNLSFQQIRPVSQLDNESPIEFNISGQNSMDYIDLRKSTMNLKVRLVKSDGSKITSTDKVGPVNLLLHSLFSQVEVNVQNKSITSSTTNYPYKAMIQTLLKYGHEAKDSQLTSQLYYADTPNYFDDSDPDGQNIGLYTRSQFFKDSKLVDLQGNIYHPLLALERYILNSTGMTIKFFKSKPEFYLMSSDEIADYRIEIVSMHLNICRVSVNPGVIYGHNEILKTTNAKYPFVNTDVKLLSIPAGNSSFRFDQLFNSLRPNKVIIGFVSSKAASGDYISNPFRFKNYNLSQIALLIDGLPVGGNPMKLSFNGSNGSTYLSGYYSLFEVSGKSLQDSGNAIDRDDFTGGCALYGFQIEPEFDGLDYLTLLKQGNVRIEAHFNSPLPEPCMCVVYSENSGYFELTQSRDVVLQ